MSYLGVQAPTNRIVLSGSPTTLIQKVETATNCYPGRLVIKGTNDDDVVVATGIKSPGGWLGFEQCDANYQPTNLTTIYAANDQVPVVSGDCLIKMPSGLALGTVAYKNDLLFPWANGQVVPGVALGGRYAIKVPFVNASGTALVDTGIDFPAGMRITDAMLNVTTLASGATLDVGFENSVESGDLDGLLDGESCAALGLVNHNLVDASAAAITVGVLLEEVEIKDATGTPVFYGVPTGYVTDGTIKSLVYTPSNHAIAGDIYVFIESPGFYPVGRCMQGASAASAAADIVLKSLI